jgi:hypothetical protein
VGSKEFYDAIGLRLREVIYSTQVVDSTMTRSQMMRSADGRDKILTAFASEPTLAYSMLQDAVMDVKLGKRGNASDRVMKQKKHKLRKTVYAYAITNIICALVESGFDFIRDDDDEEMTAEEFLELYLKNLYFDVSILNKIPYVKEAMSLAQGFSSSRSDTQWMQYFINSGKGIAKIMSGEGDAYKTFNNILKAFSYGLGVPASALWRDVSSLLDKVGILSTEELKEILEDLAD